MRLQLSKPGIRVMGVAESFKPDQRKSTLAAVIQRADFIVDGFVLGEATVEGDDATEGVIKMWRSVKRTDINAVILSGAVLSLYNIVDIDKIGEATSTPIISITYKGTSRVREALKHHFPDKWRQKMKRYEKLGARYPLTLKSGGRLYLRTLGCDASEARTLLNRFTIQGAVPEPVRLARTLARAVSTFRRQVQ
jgi:endonuclease V-like protein UPF0215 family